VKKGGGGGERGGGSATKKRGDGGERREKKAELCKTTVVAGQKNSELAGPSSLEGISRLLTEEKRNRAEPRRESLGAETSQN